MFKNNLEEFLSEYNNIISPKIFYESVHLIPLA